MNASWNGIKAIACREALVLVAYWDKSRWSKGFGYLATGGEDSTTIEQAFADLKAHIAKNDLIIAKFLHCDVTQPQWDAVASLYYQRGTAALEAVTDFYNRMAPAKAWKEFLNWNSGQDGIETEGHTMRRIRESAMSAYGDYGDISKYKLYAGDPHTTSYVWTPFPE